MPSKVNIINKIHLGLLGEVFPSLRAVGVDWDHNQFVITSYIQGAITDKDYDSAACVSNELISLYSEKYMFDDRIIRLDEPQPIPSHMLLGYLRKEKDRNFAGKRIPDQEFAKFGDNIYPKLVCAINQALLNQVTSKLRRIDLDWNEKIIDMYFYYYYLDYDKEAHEVIIQSFMQYFPNHNLNLYVQQSHPFEIVQRRQVCGYMAREIEPKEEDEEF